MLKVLHIPVEIAGQMGILCDGLRKAGWISNGYNWFHTYLSYASSIVCTDAYEACKVMNTVFQYVDIVHFHNGNSWLPDFQDLFILKSLGKKMIMHHWGHDVRKVDLANLNKRFPLPPSYFTTEQIDQRLHIISQHIDTAIIQDMELYPYIRPYYKHIHILPLAIDVTKFVPQYPQLDVPIPLVVHAPTNADFKGTLYIESAIQSLQSKIPFRYKRIEKMNNREAINWYRQADIVIDQILVGTYGLLSVEAMATGKPVITFIRPDLRTTFPAELPLVSADPTSINQVLEALLIDAEKRVHLGHKGRQFVENHHNITNVIPKLIDIYSTL